MTTIGIGAVAGVRAEEVLAAVEIALAHVPVRRDGSAAGTSQVSLATLDTRAAEPGLVAAAERLGVPLTGHPAGVLAAVPVPAPSSRVAAAVGTPSVAEAAALLGGGELLMGKTVCGRVTVAVAG
jgi:cobalamin biosynthesis protein CbiG